MKQISRKTFNKIMKIVRKYTKKDNSDITYAPYEYDYYYIKVSYPILTDLLTCFVKLGTSDEKIEQVMNLLEFELVEEE